MVVVVGAGEGDERMSFLEESDGGIVTIPNCLYQRTGGVLDAGSVRDRSSLRAHAELIYLRRNVRSFKAPAVSVSVLRSSSDAAWIRQL